MTPGMRNDLCVEDRVTNFLDIKFKLVQSLFTLNFNINVTVRFKNKIF